MVFVRNFNTLNFSLTNFYKVRREGIIVGNFILDFIHVTIRIPPKNNIHQNLLAGRVKF